MRIVLPSQHIRLLCYKLLFTVIAVDFFHHNGIAQLVSQPAQIAWGRYFDDDKPGFDWGKEDIGEKVYYFEDNIYMVGRTKSDTNAFVNCTGPSSSGLGDAFVASYNPACHTYNWISYFGSNATLDYAYCAAIDRVGNNTWIYIAGEINAPDGTSGMQTASSCVGGPGIYQSQWGNKFDAFIAKYNAETGELIRWTYLGGDELDQILGMAIDPVTHYVYFTGYTESPDFMPAGNIPYAPYKGTFTGTGKIFIGALDSCLHEMEYCTLYGGNGNDRAHDLEILSANNTRYLVVSGTTQSISGIVPAGGNSYDNTYGGTKDLKNPDGFLLLWNVNTLYAAPDWSTYWGGSDIDRGRGISLTSLNEIYFTGQTLSSPDTGSNAKFVTTPDAYMTQKETRHDNYLAKFQISSFTPLNVNLELFTYLGGGKDDYAKTVRAFRSNASQTGTDSVVIAGLTYSADMKPADTTAYFLSKEINGKGNEKKRDAFIAVLTKDPANPTAKQKLSSFAYLGGENDETDIKQDSTLVQKSYNPGIDIGPNGSVYIMYTTKGVKTKQNGKIPVEYSAYHNPIDPEGKVQPDAYFAQVYPFPQNFVTPVCNRISSEENSSYENSVISAYPVPTSSDVTLKITGGEETMAQLWVYDILGNMILNQNIPVHSGENKVSLALSQYPAGIFMARIKMQDKDYEVKIVKE